MPTGATFRALIHLDKFLEAQDCNGRFSKTLVPGNYRKKTITGLSNKHHCQDFVWCLVNTTLRIWTGSKHQKISVRLLLILSSFSLPRGSAGKTNRGDCVVCVGLQCRGKADQDSLSFEGFKSGRSSKRYRNWVEILAWLCLEMK